ncbi:hypothetical protein F5Y12DRAFT_689337 [Xylaria sp. FL1777]|nr:hypothetical protein F5Y12DRAFT_689337 [Xylaria sp. FL1777]
MRFSYSGKPSYYVPCSATLKMGRQPSKMSTYSHEPKEESLEAFQAWGSVREHRNQIEKAAKRLKTVETKANEQPEASSAQPHPLSAIEKLPEEVLISIMEYLDYESLYRLSQTTGHFLRLSFDIVFELDSSWRTFRHTVDRLSYGPQGRVFDAARPSQNSPAVILDHGLDVKPEPIKQPSKESGAIFDTDDGGEGETMLEFMARNS